MPELPEVESGRHLVETHCTGSSISELLSAEMGGGPRDGQFDDKVYEISETVKGQGDYEALQGLKLLSVGRQGKQLWFMLDGGLSLLFHFGMTGSFVLKGHQIPSYKSFVVNTSEMEWPPKFTKCLIKFSNGEELAFCDPRRLGKIRIRGKNPSEELPISKLAPDPMQWGGKVPETFFRGLAKMTPNIKSVLLDQEKVVSGVGNWVADEVLYQSGIHPSVPCKNLPEATVLLLGNNLMDICRVACECTCSFKSFPEEWLFHTRWGKGKSASHDFHGNLIAFETVGGRTSAIVAAKQKKTFKEGEGAPTEGAKSSKYFAGKKVKEEGEERGDKKGKGKKRAATASTGGGKKSKAVKKEKG